MSGIRLMLDIVMQLPSQLLIASLINKQACVSQLNGYLADHLLCPFGLWQLGKPVAKQRSITRQLASNTGALSITAVTCCRVIVTLSSL